MNAVSLEAALKKAGLKFKVPSGQYDFSSLHGKRCFGSYLADPNVHSVSELIGLARQMSPITRVPVSFKDPSTNKMRESKNNFLLVDERTGEDLNVVSEDYNLVQDKDLMMQVADGIRDLGLTPVGSVRARGLPNANGVSRMQASIIIADPDYTIPILQSHDRFIATGFNFTNSYSGDLGIHVEAAGIDTFCTNYNLWGKVLGEYHATHLKQGDLTREVEGVLKLSLQNAPKAQAIIKAASEVRILDKEVFPTLAGAGFGMTQTDVIDNMKGRLEPDTRNRLTALTLNQAATAYVTHMAASADPSTMRDLSAKAMRILDVNDLVKMQERGREVVKQWVEEKKVKEEARKKKLDAKVAAQNVAIAPRRRTK